MRVLVMTAVISVIILQVALNLLDRLADSGNERPGWLGVANFAAASGSAVLAVWGWLLIRASA